MFQTEVDFTLPLGLVDADGTLCREGTMRRATAADEILPLRDARVQANVRQQIFNRKDQTLKNAFSEAARNKATVVNYLAQRILDNAGKTQ